jgi:hypothetical protein
MVPMEKKEQVQFVFTFEYDSVKMEEFESIWNLGFKMLKMVDDYTEECCSNYVNTTINESPGAVVHRKLISA